MAIASSHHSKEMRITNQPISRRYWDAQNLVLALVWRAAAVLTKVVEYDIPAILRVLHHGRRLIALRLDYPLGRHLRDQGRHPLAHTLVAAVVAAVRADLDPTLCRDRDRDRDRRLLRHVVKGSMNLISETVTV
jgi:hypothetical protein